MDQSNVVRPVKDGNKLLFVKVHWLQMLLNLYNYRYVNDLWVPSRVPLDTKWTRDRWSSVCSTSGTVDESVVVVGHTYGSVDNVVYYLLEVRSWEMPLEGYMVRRRYNNFRTFYQELTTVMPSQQPRSSTTSGFGLSYSSLLCNPLTMEKAVAPLVAGADTVRWT